VLTAADGGAAGLAPFGVTPTPIAFSPEPLSSQPSGSRGA
jgi:hypothetical protein